MVGATDPDRISPRGIDELEAYLPQLGHLILRLPSESLLATVLERFALRVSETNVHWALQLIWTVYANLEGTPAIANPCLTRLRARPAC